jgi:hypothetical protein
MALTLHPTTAASAGCLQARDGTEQPAANRVRLLAWSLVPVAAIVGALLLIGESQSAQIIRNAVCTANAGQVDCNSAGLGGITGAADALISPVFVALVAICPIACLVGAGAVMFGHRRGVIIVASALGALVLAGAVKGIVA